MRLTRWLTRWLIGRSNAWLQCRTTRGIVIRLTSWLNRWLCCWALTRLSGSEKKWLSRWLHRWLARRVKKMFVELDEQLESAKIVKLDVL